MRDPFLERPEAADGVVPTDCLLSVSKKSSKPAESSRVDLEAGEVAEKAVFPNSVESRFQIDRDNDGSLLPLKAVEGLLSNVHQDVGRHSALLESCLLGRNGFDVAGRLLEPNGDEALHDLGVTGQQRHRMLAFYLARWLSVLQDRNDDRFSPFARCSSFGPTPVDDAQELIEAFVGEVLDHSGVDLVFTICALLHLLDDVIQLYPAEGVTGRVVSLGSFVESPHFEVSFSASIGRPSHGSLLHTFSQRVLLCRVRF